MSQLKHMGYIISKDLSNKVAMSGVYYKHNHPGGISAVVQYWSKYIDGIKYYPTFKEGSKLTKVLTFVNSYLQLAKDLIFDRQIKIVHIHTAAGTDFYRSSKIIELAKRHNKKVILHSHASQFKDFYGSSSGKNKIKIIQTLREADVLIVLSESWANWFENIGVDPKKIVILHNITDYPIYTNKSNSTICNFIDTPPVRFLFMGEIGPRKGIFDIIKALALHKNEIEGKLELRIGGNKREDELLEAIEEGGLSNVVKFEGWISGEKKIELLNWADIFILPSYNEGLPISILEAMSYRMPIISTPVGGIPEVVNELNGKLVSPGDVSQIYSAMKYYVDNRQDIILHGNASKIKVEPYMPNFVMTHLKKIYESLIY